MMTAFLWLGLRRLANTQTQRFSERLEQRLRYTDAVIGDDMTEDNKHALHYVVCCHLRRFSSAIRLQTICFNVIRGISKV